MLWEELPQLESSVTIVRLHCDGWIVFPGVAIFSGEGKRPC